ncbi:hypothetical protein RB597_010277 [Gaeumannomyces tritici]
MWRFLLLAKYAAVDYVGARMAKEAEKAASQPPAPTSLITLSLIVLAILAYSVYGRTSTPRTLLENGGNAKPAYWLSFWRKAAPEEVSRNTDPGPSEGRLLPSFPDGIKVLHECSGATVDICFVHGLSGDRSRTWTADGQSEPWPKTLLPPKLNSARILTYGYDAYTVRKSVASSNRLIDHATNLLHDLTTDRASCNASSRPLIFVAHSLGGLVCKEAILLSRNNPEPHLRCIFDRTEGIIFMGTPHEGSWMAAWAKIPASALGLVVSANMSLLKILDTDDQFLESVQVRFLAMIREQREAGRHFGITCFFEELPLIKDWRVVSKKSATFEGYHPITIHANHSDMVKFASVDDNGFKRLLGELIRWESQVAQRLPAIVSKPAQECLRSLAFPQMQDRYHDINPAVKGTCEWFLEHETYKSWTTCYRSLLWIKGKPGSGKSTLLKYALGNHGDQPGLKDGDLALSFFFHGRGVELQKTPLGLFRSLLHQVLSQAPDASPDLVGTFERNRKEIGQPGKKWEWHQEQLQSFFELSLSNVLKTRPVWLFVDALDECGKKHAVKLVEKFKSLLKSLPSRASFKQLRICFACRHYPILDQDGVFEICLENENRKDISTYVQGSLSALSVGTKSPIPDLITVRAEGVFLWACLVVKRVLELEREAETSENIEAELRFIPRELDELYQGLIRNMRPASLKLMQWICFAVPPPSIGELPWAMALEANRPCRPPRECQSGTGYESDNGRMKRRVQMLSCGLAEVTSSSDAQVVQFIHQSVKDFLVEKGLSALESGLTSTGLAIEMAHHRLSSAATTAIVLGASRTSSPSTLEVVAGASRQTSCGPPTEGGFPGLASLNGVRFNNDVGSLLMPELPWFRLRRLLQNRGFVPEDSNYEEMVYRRSRPASAAGGREGRNREVTHVAIANRQGLLAKLLGHYPKGHMTELVQPFISHIEWLVPQESHGDLEGRVRRFLDPANSRPLQCLFELASFFASNNMLGKDQVGEFLKWVIDQNYVAPLAAFLHVDSATTRSFAQNILEPAVQTRNTELLGSLLSLGLDFRPVLEEAISTDDDDFVRLLLASVPADCLAGDSGGRLLLAIADLDRVDIAEILVEKGANVNFNPYKPGKNSWAPLWWAVHRGHLNMARCLLKQGADVNLECNVQDAPTPLGALVDCAPWESPNLEIAELLLDYGADIECTVLGHDFMDYVSLHHKALRRFILQKLDLKGRAVSICDILDEARKGHLCLSTFVHRNEGEISQDLLEKALYESMNLTTYGVGITEALLTLDGVDANGPTLDEPPLMLAAICEDKAVCLTRLLIGAGADTNIDGILRLAVDQRNFELLQLLLLDGRVNIDEQGPPALELAVLDGMVEAVALLLDKGTPIDAVGETLAPVQAAARSGSLGLAEYLIERGADVNAPAYGHKGRTALQAACCAGDARMVGFLLGKGAMVNAAAAAWEGVTAVEGLVFSTANQDVKERLFRLLFEKDRVVLQVTDANGRGVAHKLIEHNLPGLLDMALELGADSNQMSLGREGRTPLQLAAEKGSFAAAKLLVKHRAEVNALPAPHHGRTALQAAASCSTPNMDMIRFLVDAGAVVNAGAGVRGGITAIQGAAISGYIPVAEYLVQKGADVNSAPALRDGRTAIEGAAEHGRLDMVRFLLNCGAKGDTLSGTGFQSAITFAEENGHFEVANLLRLREDHASGMDEE